MKSRKRNVLDEIQIPEPCTADWESMMGDDRRRFCAKCRKSVFNLSAMTLRQAETLIAASNGQLCAQIVRRPDGTTVSLETATVQLLRRQPWPVASAVMTVMLGVGPTLPVLAATGPQTVITAPIESSKDPAAIETRESAGQSTQDSQPQSSQSVTGQSEVREVTLRGRVLMPERSLRTLYTMSDLIVVARRIESTKLADGDQTLVQTTLSVSQTLKGKHRDFVHVYHDMYRYWLEFNDESYSLVFLKQRDPFSFRQPRGYVFADYSRAVKLPTEKFLEKYVERLTELDAIMQRRRFKPQEIVEWLVRCTEDSDTRREGVAELAAGLPRSGSMRASLGDDAGHEPQDFVARQAALQLSIFDPGGSLILAAFLSDGHKDRLMNALQLVDELKQSDIDLINLVSKWNEPRLMPFLVAQLRRMEATAPQIAQSIITIVDEILADEAIGKLAEEYHDNVSYEDLAQEEADAGETAEAAEADDEEEPADPEEEEMTDADAEPERPRRTPELALAARRVMLKRFIEAVEARLARERSI